MTASRPMDSHTFNRFRAIVYEKSGISLSERKDALVSARVGKRMRVLGMTDYRKYLRFLMDDQTGREVVEFLNVMSTNVTGFFREPSHFDFLRERAGEWLGEGQRRFRMWSAACSTGEEAYSLAITLLDSAQKQGVNGLGLDMRILATDISTAVLDTCCRGTYHEDRVTSVPEAMRKQYFDVSRNEPGKVYTVKRVLKDMIVFRRLNLSQPPFPMRGPMDMVFCRNVMIYFDNTVRKKLLGEIHRLLRPGGYLIVGHAESLTGMLSELEAVRPSIYVKR